MPLNYPAGYYSRFDPEKRYTKHIFRAGKVLQSAELVETQDEQHFRLKQIADTLYKDGDIVRGCGLYIDRDSAQAHCESGAFYADGSVFGVPEAVLTIPLSGHVQIGIYLTEELISELQDPDLRDPAAATRNYQEPGAYRLRVTAAWGLGGGDGRFIPVFDIDDGEQRAKTAPPTMDAMLQALAKYDRDSAGGHYIVRGLTLKQEADDDGVQVYSLAEGAARVSGYGLEVPTSRRLRYPAVADLHWVDSEPHQSTTTIDQRIEFDRWPIAGVPEIRITARKTVTIVHGGFTGIADPLPDEGVIEVETIVQGGTNYVAGTSWNLVAGQIDWSPAGPEPKPGSTYNVTYKHIRTAVPKNATDRECYVDDALVGTLILVSYNQALRRIDRLCIDRDGILSWVQGVSAQWLPTAPNIPYGRLAIASVYQTWDSRRRVVLDGVRMVPMETLSDYQTDLNSIREDLAEVRLAVDVQGRYSGIKKGLFADPFVSNEMRDHGIAQDAIIVSGGLYLPLDFTVHQLGVDITERQSLPHTYRRSVSQPSVTGSMKINPYMAFAPIPAAITLIPAVDRWTTVAESYAAPITQYFAGGSGTVVSTKLLSEEVTDIEFLRTIDVEFHALFDPAEGLASLTFDGITVVPSALPGGALTAGPDGVLKGKFTIPGGIKAGTKEVVLLGTQGSRGVAFFTGQGVLVTRELQRITTIYYNADPLCQTFSFSKLAQIAGVDLWFTAIGTSDIVIQVRETENGIPTSRVIAEKRVRPSEVVLNTMTRIAWTPIALDPNTEYGIVALCDDAVAALGIAELGKWDIITNSYVTSQPYQIGVLQSSSNASTWTAHQDKDLAFHALTPVYTATERVIDLGTVDVNDCTDIMVQGYGHIPSTQCSLTYRVQVGAGQPFEVSASQAVRLSERFTGQIKVSAILRGTADLSPIMEPGVQLIAASLRNSGTYVTPMLNAGGTSTLRVIFESDMPSGSNVNVAVQAEGEATWTPVALLSTSPYTAGVIEFTHELEGYTADRARFRLTLTGTHAARPVVNNLRAVVLS